MASKRPRPYDVPPSPDSSEEEEDDEEVEEQEQEEEQVEEQEEEEVEEDEEEEEDDKTTPVKTLSKDGVEDEDGEEDTEEEEVEEEEESDEPVKQTPDPVADSGSETETETDATPRTSSYTIKPVSKVENPVKGSKPEKVKEDDEKKGNSMITRVWSFDDEIYVMQAMIDFKKDNNKDPTSSHEDFFNFVKGNFSGKFTKAQVMDKVRRLKKKYRNYLNKYASSGKEPDFSNPHEFKCFRLSKTIWGDLINGSNAVVSLPVLNGGDSNGNRSGKTVSKSAKKSKTGSLEKVISRVEEADMMEVDEGKVKKEGEKGFGELYPHLMKAFEGESVPRVPLLDGLKGCLSTIESSKLEEWDRKWKNVRLAETDAYIGRLALIQEQTSWFSDAMKSSKY